MRAVVCHSYGPPEDLVVDEVADPVPGSGQLVVRVHAAAVNFPDVLMIAGKYQVKAPVPFTPGSELAGEVIAVGEGVPYRPGQRVSATTFVGAFAEQTLLHSAMVTDLAAVDLAVALKARVLAAASSAEKLELCRQRGAEATVDYDREDLKMRIRELTGDAARVVLDPVGGPYAEPALRGLARGGTFITLGYAAGVIPSIPLNLVLLKGITVRGMEIRTFVSDRPADSARDMQELTQMFASGVIRPYIGARFALADTAAALRHVADRKAIGKVLIDVTG